MWKTGCLQQKVTNSVAHKKYIINDDNDTVMQSAMQSTIFLTTSEIQTLYRKEQL